MNFTRSFSSAVVLPLLVLLASCADTNTDPTYPKATHLYFTDYSGRQVGVVDLNNIGTYTSLFDANDGLDTLAGLTIDFTNGHLYTVEETNNRVLRLNLDGSDSPTVLYDEADSVNMPTAIAIDVQNKLLYWANSGTGQLKSGPLAGGDASGSMYNYREYIDYCYGLVIDNKNHLLYFSDLGDQASIWAARTDGTGSRGILFGSSILSLQNPSALYYDEPSSSLFWADEGLQKIVQGTINGGTLVLYDREDGVTRPDAIAVDRGNSMIYWSETASDPDTGAKTHQIKRAAMDGTGTPEVVVDGVESYGMVLRFANQ
ncbi:NHL repeat-containing protein [Parachryseolinea silvisoli]|uniref:hypothetical protein n=1 Tax=Parachryseolinea silvisoli TaxID=2873601 RepID=UPI002265EB5E|nr:hypothetical protein [Parachryseolinea silvisoli]MCD9016750.1 hypothetical protein [Parachryseolinea silvisoli]